MQLADCDRIYRAAWETSDSDRFRVLCLELLETYRCLSVGIGRGNVFWRARIMGKEPFRNISEMGHPPPEVARGGRLNRAGQSCFYISSNAETAVREVSASKGQHVQMAGYRVRAGAVFNMILIGEYAHVSKRGYTSLNGTDPGGTIKGLIRQHSKLAPVMISIDKFFAAVLSDPKAHELQYMRTQVLGELLHKRIDSAHAIAFPSVRDPLGFNFAVLAAAAPRIFENTSCVVQAIGDLYLYDQLEQTTICSALAVKQNGDFLWPEKPVEGQWYQYGLSQDELEKARSEGKRIGEGRYPI